MLPPSSACGLALGQTGQKRGNLLLRLRGPGWDPDPGIQVLVGWSQSDFLLFLGMLVPILSGVIFH